MGKAFFDVDHAPKSNRTAPGLIRGLGLWSAIAVIVGSMIGQAVFLVASDMVRESVQHHARLASNEKALDVAPSNGQSLLILQSALTRQR